MGQYTPKDLFYRAHKPLLGRFFHQHGALTEIDFSKLKPREYQPILKAWNALDDATRRHLDGLLLAIHEIASEKGIRAILDAVQRTGFESEDSLARLRSNETNLLERAFIAYLDFDDYWPKAREFFFADNHTTSYKRRNLPRKTPTTDRGSIAGYQKSLGDYFNQTQGKGQCCKAEHLSRNDLDYVIALLEDYTEQRPEWEGGAVDTVQRRPAFEIVCVYDRRHGTLDTHCPGGRKVVEAVQAFFALHILKAEKLDPDEDDDRVYELEPLLDRTFAFRTDTSEHVRSIRRKHFRFTEEVTGDRVILATDTRKDPYALNDMLDRYRDAMRLGNLALDQVKFSARAADPATGEWKTREFNITLPNACALKYEGRDLAIRQVLEASDIEARQPDSGR